MNLGGELRQQRMGQSAEAIKVFKNIQVNGLERSAQILATILSLKPTRPRFSVICSPQRDDLELSPMPP